MTKLCCVKFPKSADLTSQRKPEITHSLQAFMNLTSFPQNWLKSFFSFLFYNEYLSVSTKWLVSISLFPVTYELHVAPSKITKNLKIRLVSPKKAQEVPSLSYPVSAQCCMKMTELGHRTRHWATTELDKGEAERRVGSSNVSSSCGEKLELACTFITALIALHGLSHECSLQQVGFKTSAHKYIRISCYPFRPSALTRDFLTQNEVLLPNFLTSLHLNSITIAFHTLFTC
jgi:hypothetical protein